MAIKQLETAYIASGGKICLPERAWTHHPGSNNGDTISNVAIPSLDNPDVWRMTWKEKKEFYGKKHLILVGGKTDVSSQSPKIAKRSDATIEPVCFHPFPIDLYEDLIDGFYVKLIIDLSPDMMLAWACLKKRIGYVGICYTQAGADMGYQYLFDKMKVPQCLCEVMSKNMLLKCVQYFLTIRHKLEDFK